MTDKLKRVVRAVLRSSELTGEWRQTGVTCPDCDAFMPYQQIPSRDGIEKLFGYRCPNCGEEWIRE